MPELDVGLAGGSGFLMQHFSRSMARYMCFTSRRISRPPNCIASASSRHVLPPEKLMAEARAIAAEIAAKSPSAVRAVKRAFNVVEEMPTRDAYRYEQTITVRPLEVRGHQGGAGRLRGEAQAELPEAAVSAKLTRPPRP